MCLYYYYFTTMFTLSASVLALPAGQSSQQTLNQDTLQPWRDVQCSFKHDGILTPPSTVILEPATEISTTAQLRKRTNKPPNENPGSQGGRQRRRRSDLPDKQLIEHLRNDELEFFVTCFQAKVRSFFS